MPFLEIKRKFKAGTLRSSSGDKVTNPKQANAIALSYKRGASKHASPRRKASGFMSLP